MTISIWRYSHLALAIFTSLFLLIASLTGVILAIEPIQHQAKGFAAVELEEVTLATTVLALNLKYDEVFSIEVESSDFVKASVLTEEMETLDVYVNPKTGERLGVVPDRPEMYRFATNLHRSLFLKSVGRFFIGLVSLLLVFIIITGLILLAKRQGGLKKIFAKVQKDYFELRYHVILSRWFLVPLLILAVTGVYLSAEKFELLPGTTLTHQEKSTLETPPKVYGTISDIPIFQEITLDHVRKVEFPFTDDPEDYFQIGLEHREIKVNQKTGEIISSAEYPFVTIASRLSLILHTGEGNPLWSGVLLLASGSLLFFIYSGFTMTLKRRTKAIKSIVMPTKEACDYFILVGSETGSTFDNAKRFYKALSEMGKKVYLTELNEYASVAGALSNSGEKPKQLIIFTSTYGDGEPPTNARKFESLFKTIDPPKNVVYSVVGFGSLAYPNYCAFAIKTEALLQEHQQFKPLLPLFKINDNSFSAFQKWVQQWGEHNHMALTMNPPKIKRDQVKERLFKVIERTSINKDDTFLIRIRPVKKTHFTSGDLLSITPQGTSTARQYSIAKLGQDLLLSVKRHEYGRGSSFLYSLKNGDRFKGSIESNDHFHFPSNAPSAILISNGTGIAPFLGMIQENQKTDIQLYWGGRTHVSSDIYDPILHDISARNKKLLIEKAFSREDAAHYVQDIVAKKGAAVIATVEAGGVIMICGSLAMQHDVMDILEGILQEHNTIQLDDLQSNRQLLMDCY